MNVYQLTHALRADIGDIFDASDIQNCCLEPRPVYSALDKAKDVAQSQYVETCAMTGSGASDNLPSLLWAETLWAKNLRQYTAHDEERGLVFQITEMEVQ